MKEKRQRHIPMFIATFDFLEFFTCPSLASGSGAFRFDMVAVLPSSKAWSLVVARKINRKLGRQAGKGGRRRRRIANSSKEMFVYQTQADRKRSVSEWRSK